MKTADVAPNPSLTSARQGQHSAEIVFGLYNCLVDSDKVLMFMKYKTVAAPTIGGRECTRHVAPHSVNEAS